uniref:Uncharacterized protein n=1 Tax=Tanacetum cinerariifolium TaxID=118510 RepID=A0A699IS99_TANCI|nr:hypothetical protein [Tanacetum cinerariifolium]
MEKNATSGSLASSVPMPTLPPFALNPSSPKYSTPPSYVEDDRLYYLNQQNNAIDKSRDGIHTTLDTTWNTGSLSHALCASPADPLFIETLLEHNIKSAVNSHSDAHAMKAQKTIYEIKSAVCMQGHKSYSDAQAIKAQETIYEIKSAVCMQGHRALTYALLSQSFNIEWHRGKQEVDVPGETFRIRKFVCKRFDMTVRFYLDSSLQVPLLRQ